MVHSLYSCQQMKLLPAKSRLRDQCFLKKLLKHHVVTGAKSVGSLRDGDTLNTIGNEKLAISDFGDVSSIIPSSHFPFLN